MLYAAANAASQAMEKPLIEALAPRSTWIHCGSLQAEDHRVVSEPSIAADAGVPALSTDDAVASAPRAIFVSAAANAGSGNITVSRPATSASVAATAVTRRFGSVRRSTLVDWNPLREPGDLVAVCGPAPNKDPIADMQPPKRTALPPCKFTNVCMSARLDFFAHGDLCQYFRKVSVGSMLPPATTSRGHRPLQKPARALADSEDQPYCPRWTMADGRPRRP